MKKLIVALFLAGIFSAIGCSQTGSDGLATSKIYVHFEVKSSPSEGNVTGVARFFVGGPTGTGIDLQEGDEVLFEGSVMKEREDLLNEIQYEKSAIKKASGGAYSFEFRRKGESYIVSIKQADDVVIDQSNAIFTLSKANTFSWSSDSTKLSDFIVLTMSAGSGTTADFPSSSDVSFTYLANSKKGISGYHGYFEVSRSYSNKNVPAEFKGGTVKFSSTDRISITIN